MDPIERGDSAPIGCPCGQNMVVVWLPCVYNPGKAYAVHTEQAGSCIHTASGRPDNKLGIDTDTDTTDSPLLPPLHATPGLRAVSSQGWQRMRRTLVARTRNAADPLAASANQGSGDDVFAVRA